MNTHFKFAFFLLFSSFLCAQESIEITGDSEAVTFLSSDELPFWFYTNRNGFLDENTSVGVSAFAKANYDFNEAHNLEIGLGGFLRNGFENLFQRSDLYFEYENKWIAFTVGAKKVEEKNRLSTINENILFTGNVRPIPGVLLRTIEPIKITRQFAIDGALGHYRLNDERDVEKTNIHYKSIQLHIGPESNRLRLGLKHYVQWGGVTEDGIELPNDFKAFTEVFLGSGATGIDNPNENINALGNHLGSYQIEYAIKRATYNLNVYHHTLFDDRSGRELNNFPDGVWGIHINTKKSKWLESILYEYVQTLSQSGRPKATSGGQQSGGDNYFSNSIYTSGWQYEGVTIGLPFIIPSRTSENPNNRILAHHLGAVATFDHFTATGKITYLEGLGTYGKPFVNRQKSVLSSMELMYATDNSGVFYVIGGYDLKNFGDNNYALGLGYRYTLN